MSRPDRIDSDPRFPGFDSLGQHEHWDPVTAGVVWSRVGMPPGMRFLTPSEQAVAIALCDQLLGQEEQTRLPVVNLIDARLAEMQTDGWHYEDMPEDGQAWRDSLAALDDDAETRFDSRFAECSPDEQADLIQSIQDLDTEDWHGLRADHVWSLWTRYACTAFYADPAAWNEIGFPGPAYPRGYKNIGLDAREPFEVPDARPSDDPAAASDRGAS